MKKGFTLIELLAVIVVLAILVLVCIPVINGLIDSSKKATAERSMQMYVKAVEMAYVNYRVEHDGIKTNDLSKLSIDYSGNKVTHVNVVFSDGMVSTASAIIIGYSCEYKNEAAECEKITGDITPEDPVTTEDPVTQEDPVDTQWTYTDTTNDGVIGVGDMITIDTESFYIISKTDTEIRALARYNLYVGIIDTGKTGSSNITDTDGLQSAKAVAFTGNDASIISPYYGVVKFANSSYWDNGVSWTGTGSLKPKYGATVDAYPAYVYDENSLLYSYITDYVGKLKEKGSGNVSGLLISQEELYSLGCGKIYPNCQSSSKSWLYNMTYWTGTSASAGTITYVSYNGAFGSSNPSTGNAGLRPLIVIPTSYIKK